jgi:NAD(P)-dependent dehydrogenase (short-subunit alcohol dehydrogenase family)
MGALDGKVAVITGGASGIGRASALRFVAEGARVALGDVQAAAMSRMVEEIGADRCLAVPTDATEERQVEALVQRTVECFGKVDTGLFCAGIGGFGPVHRMDSALFDRVIRLNLYGVFFALKRTAAWMVEHGTGGSLTAIASLNAHQPAEGLGAYCASKAAVAMLMQNAALELGRHGIRCNAIGPGLVETPLSAPLWQNEAIRDAFIAETPAGRYAQPEEVAALAVYLASDAAAFLTGQTIYLDGGQSLKKYPELFKYAGP